jgi:microcystin-dependent protein
MSNSANFKIDTRGIVNAVEDEDMATGDVKFWPSEVVPAGWIVRDGRALSRVAYATLFAVLGTRYGAGDGVTTFNIPDDRGEFVRCADMGRGVDAGREIGSLQQATAIRELIDSMPGYPAGVFAIGVRNEDGRIFGAGSNGSTGSDTTFYEAAATAKLGYNNNRGFFVRPRNRAYVPLIKY